ncbi:MAG: cupin domain-containing protein [Actinomycetota bacterium]
MHLDPATPATEPNDLRSTPIHLGIGGRASLIRGFSWDPDALAHYREATTRDGPDGRLVMIFEHHPSVPMHHWERHPAGDEVLVCLTGHLSVEQSQDGNVRTVHLRQGDAVINPPHAWHRLESFRAGLVLAITPGRNTEHTTSVGSA